MTLTEMLELLPRSTELRRLMNGWRVSLKNNFGEEEDYTTGETPQEAVINAIILLKQWIESGEKDFCPSCLLPKSKNLPHEDCLVNAILSFE